MKKERSKIKLEWQSIDVIMEAAAMLGLAALLAIPLFHYGSLPDRIPIHFNAKGDPDDYGSKLTVWLLPATGLLMYILLTLLNKFPYIFNYLTEITEANAEGQYRTATRMIRALKAIILVAFAYILFEIIKIAIGNPAGPGSLFMVVFLGAVFGTIGYFLVKSIREK